MAEEEAMKLFFQINSYVLDKFKKSHVYFSRPRTLALYDFEYGKYTPANKFRYHFKKPRSSDYPLNLNEGNESDSTTNGSVEHINVYTRRGIMVSIMEFCYGSYDFDVLVTRHKGNIFMIRQQPTKDEFDREQVCFHHRRLSQLLFVDTKDDNSSNDNNIFQITVHQSTLGKYNFNYVSRAQGIDASGIAKDSSSLDDFDKLHFVATKQMWSSIKNKDKKLLKYWLQAYLSKVVDLYLAYKDERGIVRQPIEHLRVCDIPKKCNWEPGICTTFLNVFLENVEHLMSSVNSIDTVYKFHFNAKDKTIYYKIYEGKTELSFVPKEYVNVNCPN